MKAETDSIIAELNRIGWPNAKAYNRSLAFGILPDRRAGLLFESKLEAEQGAEAIDDLLNALIKFADAKDRLTPKQRQHIGFSAATPEQLDRGEIEDPLQSVVSNRLADAIIETLELTDREITKYWKKVRGAPRIHAAYLTAERISEIYVLGLGEMPTVGTRHDSDEPNTLFAEVTRNLFLLLKIDSGFRNPCAKAVEKLKKGRFKELMQMRRSRHRMFTFKLKRKKSKSRR